MEEKENNDLKQQNQEPDIQDDSSGIEKIRKDEDTEKWRKIGVKTGESKTKKKYEKQIAEWKEKGLLVDPENQRVISIEEHEKLQEILNAQQSNNTKESDIEKLKKEYDHVVKKKEKQYMNDLKKEKEEVEKLKEENQTILKSSQHEKKRHAVMNALSDFNYKVINSHAQSTVIDNLVEDLGFDEKGKIVVVDRDNDPVTSTKTGDDMTVQELLEKKYSDGLKYCFEKSQKQMDTGISSGRIIKGGKDIVEKIKNMSSEQYKEFKKTMK